MPYPAPRPPAWQSSREAEHRESGNRRGDRVPQRSSPCPVCASLVALAVVLAGSQSATAQDFGDPDFELPSPARPGAVLPERDERQREPREPAGEVLEVPPMIDRPLDPDEGERVVVERFELTGARDRPQHGVEVSDLEEILERARQERPEGFTVGQLQQVADQLTNHYRERGLILAQAVVPVQTVEQGVVEIEVIEGRLGAIRPRGNERYRTETLERAFSDLIGEPVSQAQTESALLTLTDYPGLAAFGVFEPGREVGEADLVLQVQSERRFEGRIQVDNHGTRQTGRGRARAQVHWNNITGNADRLTFTGLHSFQPANSAFGSLEYERMFGRHYRAGTFYRANRFDVGGALEDFEISGETDQLGLFGTRTWVRSRDLNVTSRLSLTGKRSRTLREDEQVSEDRLTVLALDVQMDSVDARFGGLNFAGLEFNQGFNDALGAMGDSDSAADLPPDERPSRGRGGNGEFPEGQFSRLFGYFSRLQNITDGQSLLLRTELQYSDDLLVPLEQYAIGGANHVRAFPTSHALVDTGWLVSAEYVMEAPWLAGTAFGDHAWRDVLRATVFYDYAGGRINEPRSDQPDGSVAFHGIGAGLNFDIPGLFRSRLQIAWEIDGDDEIADPDAVRSPQIWADINYRF